MNNSNSNTKRTLEEVYANEVYFVANEIPYTKNDNNTKRRRLNEIDTFATFVVTPEPDNIPIYHQNKKARYNDICTDPSPNMAQAQATANTQQIERPSVPTFAVNPPPIAAAQQASPNMHVNITSTNPKPNMDNETSNTVAQEASLNDIPKFISVPTFIINPPMSPPKMEPNDTRIEVLDSAATEVAIEVEAEAEAVEESAVAIKSVATDEPNQNQKIKITHETTIHSDDAAPDVAIEIEAKAEAVEESAVAIESTIMDQDQVTANTYVPSLIEKPKKKVSKKKKKKIVSRCKFGVLRYRKQNNSTKAKKVLSTIVEESAVAIESVATDEPDQNQKIKITHEATIHSDDAAPEVAIEIEAKAEPEAEAQAVEESAAATIKSASGVRHNNAKPVESAAATIKSAATNAPPELPLRRSERIKQKRMANSNSSNILEVTSEPHNNTTPRRSSLRVRSPPLRFADQYHRYYSK